ncbi:MAG: SDR family NAD(P)-dependent oxidoreductase, partial [Solirubrobacterales bacterium]
KGPELEEIVSSLPGTGHRAIVTDLSDDGAAVNLAAETGDTDILVANAGLPATGRLDDLSQEEIGRPLRVNLEAPIRMTRELLPGMRERGEGHIVLVASLAGKVASLRASIYSATKFGLRGFGMALRDDLHGTGIGVSVVLPGFIRDAGMFADSGASAPLGLGTASPQEVADGVVKAIEKDKQQVHVAPLRQRFMVGFAHRYPGLASRVQRAGGAAVAEEITQGQIDKR